MDNTEIVWKDNADNSTARVGDVIIAAVRQSDGTYKFAMSAHKLPSLNDAKRDAEVHARLQLQFNENLGRNG